MSQNIFLRWASIGSLILPYCKVDVWLFALTQKWYLQWQWYYSCFCFAYAFRDINSPEVYTARCMRNPTVDGCLLYTDVTKITWMIQIKEVGSVCRWSPSCSDPLGDPRDQTQPLNTPETRTYHPIINYGFTLDSALITFNQKHETQSQLSYPPPLQKRLLLVVRANSCFATWGVF